MLVGGSIIANAILEDYTSLARREEETIQLREKAEALMKTAQAAEQRLEKQKAEFEALKKTEEWAASSGLKQELNNLKATNAILVKEKTAAEVAIKEVEARGAAALKEVEVRAAAVVKELANANANANADCSKLSKTVEELQIVEAIHDAPENTVTVANVNECARQAGFKAGYNLCLNDVNPFFTSKFTDEQCGLHSVDTEAAFDATVDAYNSLTIPVVDHIEACLEVDDYVDRLRMLFGTKERG
ncbi:hypothetical protein HanLR1_Chr07g0232151 [Helianthus annuus]|nr:hypothetical protein HanLR1_Chr07g0232151 [Helianthus annuus]